MNDSIEVYLNSERIPTAMIEGLSFICDLTEMYCSGEIIIKDLGKLIANKIKIGSCVEVNFISKSSTFKNKMMVRSFRKVVDQANNLVNIIYISIISEWFYNSKPMTLAFKGSYGQWVQRLQYLAFKQSVGYGSFKTDDTPKVRYMINKRPQEFLYESMKYGVKDNMPVYLHTLPTNKVVLDGIADLIKETDPNIVLYSQAISSVKAADEADNSAVSSTSSLDVSKINIRLESYNLNTDAIGCNSAITYRFTTDLFKCSNESHMTTAFTMSSVENSNDQVEYLSPTKTEYFGWEITPDDSVALGLKKGLEEVYNIFSMTATLAGTFVKDIYPGKTVAVKLLENVNGKDAIGGGLYLVKRAAYQLRRGVPSTILTLVQCSV